MQEQNNRVRNIIGPGRTCIFLDLICYTSPFMLKWVGGKTQLLDRLISKFPTTMNNYHEIFIGGGSVLFFLSLQKQGVVYIKGSV